MSSVLCQGLRIAISLACAALVSCQAAPKQRLVLVPLSREVYQDFHGQPTIQELAPEPSGKPARLAKLSTVTTPEADALCKQLGITGQPGDECSGIAILAASGRQTDRALWFVKTTTGLDSKHPWYCLDPIAVERYGRKDGSTGTTYLCHEGDVPDAVTPGHLAQLQSLAAKLNAPGVKTYAQHRLGAEIRSTIESWTKPAGQVEE